MRFLAPTRAQLDATVFAQAIYAPLTAQAGLLLGQCWPEIAQLDAAVQPLAHRITGAPLTLVAQHTITDSEHYEQRIFQRGCIATRAGNWHDLFNALAWQRFPMLKSVLNALQVEDIERIGLRERTRRQCALTQFDEAGAVLVLREESLLPLWDRHDWQALFLTHAEAWRDGRIRLQVFGHALFEHALLPDMLLVAKTVVVLDPHAELSDAAVDEFVADALLAGQCMADPQQFRPLPLSGIPGWHRLLQDADFYRRQPCFRTLRAGRVYPRPLSFTWPAPARSCRPAADRG